MPHKRSPSTITREWSPLAEDPEQPKKKKNPVGVVTCVDLGKPLVYSDVLTIDNRIPSSVTKMDTEI